MLRGELARLNPDSVLDIGCAEGWYVRQAAKEFGCWALGVEAKRERVLGGELLRLQSRAERVAIMNATLTPDLIRQLPKFDIVWCMSVVYHIVNRGGVEAGVEFLAAIRDVTGRAFFFELGAANTPEFRADQGQGPPLPADEQDPHIRGMLKAAGFAEIEELGRTWVHNREDRVVYRAAVGP